MPEPLCGLMFCMTYVCITCVYLLGLSQEAADIDSVRSHCACVCHLNPSSDVVLLLSTHSAQAGTHTAGFVRTEAFKSVFAAWET